MPPAAARRISPASSRAKPSAGPASSSPWTRRKKRKLPRRRVMNKPETGFRFIGQPMPRHEDARLLIGAGRFTDDFDFPGQTYAAMVRSPHAHARIVAIDKSCARALPGVRGVATGADGEADNLGAIPHDPLPKTRDDMKLTGPGGGQIFIGPHVLLPADKARHVGEAIAMVVAETKAQALDATEALDVVYDELPFVLHCEDAMKAGARCVSLSPLSKGAGLITGNYAIPVASLRALSVFTNTIPTQAYRSSGRPEVTFAIERLIDIAAAKLNIDRISLRRRNLVRPKAMPYRNAVGMTYDSGRYEENMDLAMRIADWDGFKARRRDAKTRGHLLALGLANYVESSIGAPKERARITIKPDGVDVIIGTQPAGQGHETSFAQVVADLLHVPVESVRIIMGDTDVVRAGGGMAHGAAGMTAAAVFSLAATTLIAKRERGDA